MLAVVTHTLVTFNFYILSILILTGFFLARLVQLSQPSSYFTLRSPVYLKPVLYRLILMSVTAILLFKVASIGIGDYYHKQALALQNANNFEQADIAYNKSSRFHETDRLLASHAELYVRLLAQLPANEVATRQQLYTSALRILDRAAAINPAEDKLYRIKGELFAGNADLVQGSATQFAMQSFSEALRLDPRNTKARYGLAKVYDSMGNHAEALQILESGLNERYTHKDIKPYLFYIIQLRIRQGDIDGARHLAGRLQGLAANDKRQSVESILELAGYKPLTLVD